MPTIGPLVPNDEPIDGKCWAQWKAGVPCPNQAETIIKNRADAIGGHGFSIVCGPHAIGFSASYPRADVEYIPFTMEKALELQAKVKEVTGKCE